MRYIQSISFLAFAVLFSLSTIAAEPNPLDADPFVGKFFSDQVTVELQVASDQYTGTILRNGKSYPASGTRDGNRLSGSFVADGNAFPFTLAANDGQLTFSSGTKIIVLARQSDNPLDAGVALPPPSLQQAGPADNSQTPRSNPAGYQLVNSTSFGQSMVAQKPGINSVPAALQSVLGDLNQTFNGSVAVARAYQDTRDPSAGGATFTARLNGQLRNGWITCKLSAAGAVVAVIDCKSDATASEWNKLLNTPVRPAGANAAEVQIREYRFPDGTGSIGLADGWTTDAQSLMQPVTIKGPAKQEIVLGYSFSVVTPNSMAVQTQMQLIEQARQMNMPPPQMPPMLVAPFSDPQRAYINLAPQIAQLAMQSNGTRFAMDNLAELQKVTPNLPNSQASVLTYGMTLGTREGQVHYKVFDRVECSPVGNDSWMVVSNSARAPDDVFDRDLPIMLTIACSLRENAQVIQQKTNENIDAMNRRFAAQQAAHKELMATYEKSNRNWERNQNIQSRSVDNFDEVIRGYRTVEDTTTGEKTQVDLGNVDQIVDKLNEGQPDRYRQIPLRDESNPLPPGR